jgi:hypothetical protein
VGSDKLAMDHSVWRNVEGQTTTIRNHLKSDEHVNIWRDVVLLKQLKG